MPHSRVTMDAGQHGIFIGKIILILINNWQQRMHEVAMAIDTSLLSDTSIAFFNHNRITVIIERERQRMKETVIGLGDPLADEIVWQMAVVTDRNVMMGALLP
ncbi:hypothetical protein V22_36840 [Calycomorphotria hydatis]|uniref:Uncharacterized protein n=1 Tax=Calycomorphotria hydatis TaxID=2528027 RepID=A0A517TDH7_9PLAN|nr:hypothetical protein V22_36840 [Calycomorphotria hydatis]